MGGFPPPSYSLIFRKQTQKFEHKSLLAFTYHLMLSSFLSFYFYIITYE